MGRHVRRDHRRAHDLPKTGSRSQRHRRGRSRMRARRFLVGKSGSIFFNGGVDEVRRLERRPHGRRHPEQPGVDHRHIDHRPARRLVIQRRAGDHRRRQLGQRQHPDARQAAPTWGPTTIAGASNFARVRPLRNSAPASSLTARMRMCPPAASVSTIRRSPSSSGPSKTTPAGSNTSSTRAILLRGRPPDRFRRRQQLLRFVRRHDAQDADQRQQLARVGRHV